MTRLPSVLCVLMKIFSQASAKKKTKMLKGFKFPKLYWLFSSEIVAVKGVNLQSVALPTKLVYIVSNFFHAWSGWISIPATEYNTYSAEKTPPASS